MYVAVCILCHVYACMNEEDVVIIVITTLLCYYCHYILSLLRIRACCLAIQLQHLKGSL